MTDTASDSNSTRKRRRRSPGPRITCEREGCNRIVNPDRVPRDAEHLTCSFFCQKVAKELNRAKRVCEATGDAEHWTTAVALSDALTAYEASDTRLYRAALDVGITDEQWHTIKDGG